MMWRVALHNVLLIVSSTCFANEWNTVIEGSLRHLIAHFLSCDPSQVFVRQLKDGVINCYNNSDYEIAVDDKKYFAKCGNSHGELLLTSVANDALCRTISASYGIAPALLLYDPESNILITELIDKKADVDLADERAKQEYLELLKRLHNSGAQFPNTFCPFKAIKHYVETALELKADLPMALLEEVLPSVATFSKEEIFLYTAPCHLDPQISNVLDTHKGMYLIDWECAAMSDPLFDVACICAIEEFTDQQMQAMLTAYVGDKCSLQDMARLYQMRILADVRYCTYCYVQTVLSPNRRELFKTFGEGFLERTIERLRKIKRHS